MKSMIVVLALCLAAANAAVVQSTPEIFELTAEGLLQEMDELAAQTAEALKHQYEGIVLEPLHQVEETLEQIEIRRIESEECVVAHDEAVVEIVDLMHEEVNNCGVVAAKTSADIMVDVNSATQQLVFGGMDLVSSYERCQAYTNVVLKKSCMAKWYVKVTLYLANARQSIKTIKQSTNERIPGVFIDADICTHTASEKAVTDLENVVSTIDTCALRI